MKSTRIASVILLLCAFGANANAQPKTREQVRSELAEAIRTGDVIANGDSGLKLNELYPSHYAKARASVADRMQQAASANGPAMP